MPSVPHTGWKIRGQATRPVAPTLKLLQSACRKRGISTGRIGFNCIFPALLLSSLATSRCHKLHQIASTRLSPKRPAYNKGQEFSPKKRMVANSCGKLISRLQRRQTSQKHGCDASPHRNGASRAAFCLQYSVTLQPSRLGHAARADSYGGAGGARAEASREAACKSKVKIPPFIRQAKN